MKEKFYRFNNYFYHSFGNGRTEKVLAYKHIYGIMNTVSTQTYEPGDKGTEEITELQYNRVKKLVLTKLLKQ